MNSCLMPAAEAIGREVTAIEGLKDSYVQKAFVQKRAFQCGYCTPGFFLACHALLTIHSGPHDVTIENWLQSNICRCTGYQEIMEEVRSLYKLLILEDFAL